MYSKTKRNVMLLLVVITNAVLAMVLSYGAIVEADLVHGFTIDLFIREVICVIGILIIRACSQLCATFYRANMLNNQYVNLFDRISKSKISAINKISTGKTFDAVTEISSLEGRSREQMILIIPTIIPLCTLLWKEWQVSWVMPVISILGLGLATTMVLLNDRLFKFSTKRHAKKAKMHGVTVDNFMNIKTIKYLGVTGFAMTRLLQTQAEYWPVQVNVGQQIYFKVASLIGSLPMLINAYLARENDGVLTFIVMTDWMLSNARYALVDFAETAIELKSAKKIIEPLKGDDDGHVITIPDEGIKLKDVFFDYGKDSIKFHIDELTFPKGSKTLVYGESGEGKSSLANLMAGAIEPTTGTVPRYDVYYIWQETECLDDSLWNNIVFNNEDGITETEVLDLFDALNMTVWFKKLKEGFNTMIGERGCKLSSGQKQRINIIRMILMMRYHSDKLFIMDEITSNLDEGTRELAIELFDKEFSNKDMTVVCISHNDGFDRICDRKIRVENHEFKEEV